MSQVVSLPPTHPVSVGLSAFDQGLEHLSSANWWSLSDSEVLHGLVALDVVQRRLDALRLRAIADVDGRSAAVNAGARNTAAWLRHRLGMRPGQAAAAVGLATAIDSGELAEVGSALSAAAITVEHAQVVRRSLDALPIEVSPQDRARAQQLLTSQGEQLDPGELTRVGLHLQHMLAPDRSALDEETATARRNLALIDDSDGTVLIRGRLDRLGAASVRTALDALMPPPPNNGSARALCAGRRRADALVELADRALAGGQLPVTAGERPTLTVTVALETLEQRLGEKANRVPAGELAWGGPISAATARRIACDAGVIPAVLGPAGEILDLGRKNRLASPALRRALAVRDQGCVAPGCDIPPAWTDAHHIQHWADGGPTNLSNLTLLCRRHHGMVHHGWEIRLADDAIPEVKPPRWIDSQQTPQRHHRFTTRGSPIPTG